MQKMRVNVIKEIYNKYKLKIQIFLIILSSILVAFLYFYIRSNIKFKKQLEYELVRVEKETELANLEKDSKEKKQKIKSLKKEEKVIRDKIEYIDKKEENGEEVSLSELEDFFKDRGF
jgi:cell division protein FtsB